MDGFLRKAQLFRATVDEHKIGQVGKPIRDHAVFHRFQPFAFTAGEAPVNDLRHGGKVVRADDGFNAIVSILASGGLTVDGHHHGRDRQRALRVGNIIAFDAARHKIQPQRIGQLLARPDGARLLPHKLLAAFLRQILCVFARHLDQAHLFSALRHGDAHLGAFFLTEQLLQHLQILAGLAQQDSLGIIGAAS